MKRREFLMATGGALAAPLFVSGDAGGAFGWNTHPAMSGNGCRVTDPKVAASPTFPSDLSNVPPFRPPSSIKTVKRRTWSDLLRSDPNELQDYLAKLKLGYDTLLNSDTTAGLAFQTSLHSFYCHGGWTPVAGAPSVEVHNTWHFLPWHRAFIYFHERALCAVPGVGEDFRLPAWDWETLHHIPDFYTALGIPSFLTGRCGRADIDTTVYAEPCILRAWLWSTDFRDFLGGPAASGSSPGHPGRASAGPHSSVHGLIVGGVMARSDVAASDPVFYSHHANIDRFWSYWMQKYPEFRKQAENTPEWFTESRMYFFDENGSPVCVRPCDVMDEQALGYCYDLPSTGFRLEDLEPFSLHDVLGATEVLLKILRTAFDAEFGSSLGSILDALHDHPWRRAFGLMDGVLRGVMQKLQDMQESSSHKQICLPAQISLPTGPDLDSGYYLVSLRSGQHSANLGTFAVFSDAKAPRERIEMAAVIPLKIFDPILNAILNPSKSQALTLVYGRLSEGVLGRDFQMLATDPKTETRVSLPDFAWSLLKPRSLAL